MAKTRTKPTKAASPVVPNQADEPFITSYKGFNRDLTCRGFKFEVGKTYTVEGKFEACSNGFHACEHPLNCFDYYAPATSRFFEVRQSGELARHSADTKVASAKITLGVELSIGDMVTRAVKWVFDQAKPENTEHATGYQGAASATGDRGAASATGYRGAASATGYQGAASATGDRGAASATGDQGAASATGKHSVACALGEDGSASADETGAIVIVNRDPVSGAIRSIFASKVGENGIKAGVFYRLSDDGEPVEAA